MAAPTGIAHEYFLVASDTARMHGYSRFVWDCRLVYPETDGITV